MLAQQLPLLRDFFGGGGFGHGFGSPRKAKGRTINGLSAKGTAMIRAGLTRNASGPAAKTAKKPGKNHPGLPSPPVFFAISTCLAWLRRDTVLLTRPSARWDPIWILLSAQLEDDQPARELRGTVDRPRNERSLDTQGHFFGHPWCWSHQAGPPSNRSGIPTRSYRSGSGARRLRARATALGRPRTSCRPIRFPFERFWARRPHRRFLACDEIPSPRRMRFAEEKPVVVRHGSPLADHSRFPARQAARSTRCFFLGQVVERGSLGQRYLARLDNGQVGIERRSARHPVPTEKDQVAGRLHHQRAPAGSQKNTKGHSNKSVRT